MAVKIEHLEIERAQKLEESIAWLSNYDGTDSEEIAHEIRVNGERSEYFTAALEKLGRLKKEHEELLQIFMKFGKNE